MSTYVLVHGAWHGGWSWQWVREILEQQHHRVFTPTMTGLGERKHLMSINITMDTMVEDVSNMLRFEDLNEVILVGHSFGGAVISGVAESFPDRVKQLVYLDAAVLENGECMFDCMPPEIAEERQLLARETSGSISLPTPTAEDLGIEDIDQWRFLSNLLTPHPLSTYATPLKLSQRPGAGLPCSYIICSNPIYGPLAWARERVQNYGWPIIEIETGHEAMISAPHELGRNTSKLEYRRSNQRERNIIHPNFSNLGALSKSLNKKSSDNVFHRFAFKWLRNEPVRFRTKNATATVDMIRRKA